MTDKPARQITKLTEIIHEKDREIAALKRELAAARERESERAIELARVERERGEVLKRVDRAQSRILELDQLNVSATMMIEVLETRTSAAETALRSSETMRLDVCAKYEHVLQLLGDQQIVEDQRAALTKILDTVRDRMRRKELDAERAVLNRKAVTSVIPERNFR